MSPVTLAVAVTVLALSASVGVVAHECAHAAVLRACGVSYRLEWLPDDAGGPVRAAAVGALARVTPVDLASNASPWSLRVAAMAPLVLAVPFVLLAAGVLPAPLDAGNPLVRMATVGLLACAVPSPADFSLLWHAERAIEAERESQRVGP